MVSSLENLSRVVGAIIARSAHPDLGAWDLVTLSVDRAEGIPGKTDLLYARTHEPLRIAVRRELLGDAAAGWRLTARVRMTPAGPMAEPHPKEGDCRLDPPTAEKP